MDILNPVPSEEAEPWLAALATTLLGTPWDDDFPRRLTRWTGNWDPERTWAVKDAHGRIVATLATEPRSVSVPGTDEVLDVDALTGVTVAATHRRRGILRQMLTASLDAARERGDVASILIAAEWQIYGRFGYAPATRAANYMYFPRRAGAQLAPAPTGSLRQVSREELGAQTAAAIFDRARRANAGGVDRSEQVWSWRLGVDGYDPMPSGLGTWILHESDDGPDGLLCWKPERDFELDGRLGSVQVLEFAAASPVAYRNLWAYLGSLDAVGEVIAHERPIDEPLHWLAADGRALTTNGVLDDLWFRIIDAPAVLTARRYARAGRAVLEIVDEDGAGFAAGRYLLDVDESGRAQCTRTTSTADVTVPQRVLASAFFGDVSVRARAVAGGVDEHSPGALDLLEGMLVTSRPPYNGTGF